MFRFAAALLAAGVVLLSPVQGGKFNKKVSIGDLSPTWSDLPGTDNKKHSLSDLNDKDLVVVAITCNACPVAQDYEDRLIAFAKKYGGKKLAVVAISVSTEEDDSLPKMKERAAKMNYSFAYLHDKSQTIGRQLGAKVTPEFFVLDKNRKIVYMGRMDDHKSVGKVKEKYLENAVDAILAGKSVTVAETNGFGCAIEYVSK